MKNKPHSSKASSRPENPDPPTSQTQAENLAQLSRILNAYEESIYIDGKKKAKDSQKFLKNDRYFTICIYGFVFLVLGTLAIRAIILFDQTRVFFRGIIRALSPFLVALLIAYILMPFVQAVFRLLRRCLHSLSERVAMVLSMLIVYILAFGLVIALLVYVLPEVVQNLGDLINYIPRGFEQLSDLMRLLEEHFPDFDFSSITNMLENVQTDLISGLRDVAGELIPALYTASVSIVQWLANFLIAIVVSIYMLYGRLSLLRMLKIVIYALFPNEKIPLVKEILSDCNQIFSKFVVSKMVDSLIIGVLCAVLMTILRLPYVFLISLIVGITNMIPYFGPFIGALPGVVIMLVIDPVKALIFLIMILFLQQFDGLVLGPKLLGNSTGMKPIWIIFAITIGGKFFGVIGMFLAVPIFGILFYLINRYMAYRLRRKGIEMEDIQ